MSHAFPLGKPRFHAFSVQIPLTLLCKRSLAWSVISRKIMWESVIVAWSKLVLQDHEGAKKLLSGRRADRGAFPQMPEDAFPSKNLFAGPSTVSDSVWPCTCRASWRAVKFFLRQGTYIFVLLLYCYRHVSFGPLLQQWFRWILGWPRAAAFMFLYSDATSWLSQPITLCT